MSTRQFFVRQVVTRQQCPQWRSRKYGGQAAACPSPLIGFGHRSLPLVAPAEASSNSNSHGFLWQSVAQGSAQEASSSTNLLVGIHVDSRTTVLKTRLQVGYAVPYALRVVSGGSSLVEHCWRVFVSRRPYSEHRKGHINISASCRNSEGVIFSSSEAI